MSADRLQGRIDHLSHNYLFGWALSCVSLNSVTELELFVDRFLIGTTITGIYRSDMNEKEYGDRKQGFHFDFNPLLTAVVDHTITVRRAVGKHIIDQQLLTAPKA